MDRPAATTQPALMDELATRYPGRNAFTDGDRRLSFPEFRTETRRLARGLHALGVRRNHKVAILMGNQIEWLLVDFAVTLLGGVLVALNTWWRHTELQHALALSDTSVLVMVDRYVTNNYITALAEIDRATLPCLQHVVCLGENAPLGAIPFARLYDHADTPETVLDEAQGAICPEDPACMLFTSGSTARSKAAVLCHGSLIANMHGIGERMHLTEQDRMLMTVSMFWSFACANGLFAAMTHGASIVLQYRYDPAEMLALIERERCTVVYTQPNIVIALHAHPDRAHRDLGSWRTGICRPQVMELLEEMGPQEMITSYGLTECYGNSCNSDAHDPPEIRRLGSGTPLPGNEIEIVDPATRAVLPDGEEGEIRIRGNVTPGYYNDPARTAESIDAQGWFHTGDIGRYEPLHRILQFRGRFKEMIKTGGINVTPADVELVLEQHPAVRQACVVSIPDPKRDEAVAALVVLNPGHKATVTELIDHCRRSVATFKVPRHLEIVPPDAMPLTDTGKVAKRLVQARLAASYAPNEEG